MKIGRLFAGDKGLWVVFFILSIISLLEVYSSIGLYAYTFAPANPSSLFLRHLAIVLATYVAIIVLSKINYRSFSRFAVLGFVASLFLLVIMFAMHDRWMRVPVIGQFQPSELAKLFVILFIARIIAKREKFADDIGTFFMCMVCILGVSLLILPENLSTAIIVFVSCYLMLYFAKIRRKTWWRILGVIALAVVVVAIIFFIYAKNGLEMGGMFRSQTWINRILNWLNPDYDALTQENMSRMAIARGGLLGVGIGNTVHARLMTQAHNDFIYAVIIEETGFVGALVIFLLYAIFYYRCVRIARQCKGLFGSLSVAGISTMIYIQALVNMAVAVGAIPVTGQTLPFIAYGGSAYLFLGCGFGIIQSVAADNKRVLKQEKNNEQ